MKIVINKRYGGFRLSHAGVTEYAKRKGFKVYHWFDDITKDSWAKYHPGEELTPDSAFVTHYYTTDPETLTKDCRNEHYFSARDIERDDYFLVSLIEENAELYSGGHADLKVVEIPDGVEWVIEEYDGMEWVAEVHRTWS